MLAASHGRAHSVGADICDEAKESNPVGLGVRETKDASGEREVVGLTTCTPVDNDSTEVTQTFYWNRAWFGLLKPVLRPFMRAFLGQDRAMVELQREGLRFEPRLMFIHDADMPAMWYHRLKKAWSESVESGKPFVNPVQERMLHWRS